MIDWKDKREFWIAGARIADPGAERMRVGSVCVQRGTVTEIVWQKSVDTDLPVLEAERFVLAPGFIDVHAHLREPGFEDKETIETGTAAAAAGGYTALLCMANTNPAIDDPSVVEYLGRRAALVGHCRLYIAGALTKGLQGEIINEYGLLKRAGVSALSDDGRWVTNSQVMRSALEYANQHDLPVIAHCEDTFLTQSSLMNEGYHATRLGLRGSPAAAEEIAVSRDIMLASLTGAHLHVAHVSTAGAVDLIRRARKRGVRVTAEATPHHFSLTDESLRTFDSNFKMNPPLRTRDDVEAMKAGLRDGTIDAIATDHAPHSFDEKEVEFQVAPFGIIGLETAVGLAFTELLGRNVLSLYQLVEKFSLNPRRIVHLPDIKIEEGEMANLSILDPVAEWIVDPPSFRSHSRNTPFGGYRLTGRPIGVLNNGQVHWSVPS